MIPLENIFLNIIRDIIFWCKKVSHITRQKTLPMVQCDKLRARTYVLNETKCDDSSSSNVRN